MNGLVQSLAYNLYLSTLVGNPAPRTREIGDRMRAPQVGDLVLEISTIYYADRVAERIGRLVRTEREPMYTAKEWYEDNEADADEPIPDERVWYIALPDGREYRWTNAAFIAVPTNILSGPALEFRSVPPVPESSHV
jgi:hypothetical protein